jgi:hypothetical protein
MVANLQTGFVQVNQAQAAKVTELANAPGSIGRRIRFVSSGGSGSRVTARRDIHPGNGFTATVRTHPDYSASRRKCEPTITPSS